MWRDRILVLLCCGACLILAGAAAAEKRVALVIGNSDYKHATELTNPKNDATDMAAALKALGVTVIEGIDLDKQALDRKIRDFSIALSGADVGVFFYAGHGLQVNGNNYIVPIDAELSTPAALEFEMVRLDLVQRIMEGEAKINILFLDACRNNPLSRNLARALGTRAAGIGRGLAAAESGVGTLISFSTQPGNVALDGSGRNSPYTGPLVKAIATPGEDVLSVLTSVRNDVLAATGEKQVPWENHALRARFYFNGGVQPPVSSPPSAPAITTNEAAQAWGFVQASDNPAVLEGFRRQFGATNPFYDQLAASRMETLRRAAEAERQQLAMLQAEGDAKRTKEAEDPAKSVAVPKVGETFRDCPDCPEMVAVQAGSYTMGSSTSEISALKKEFNSDWYEKEGPQRKVTIAKPFSAGRYAVTFDEWDSCVAAGGCNAYKPYDKGWGRGKRPVINVSWDDAKAYVSWLSGKAGKPYRLLSEAEREYVARAGTTTAFWWGNSISASQANYDGNHTYAGSAKGEYRNKTMPVDSFEPNPWGLYQVHGNVFEWVEDCWHDSYKGAPTDGSAWTSACRDSGHRVVRGGSWVANPVDIRAAKRSEDTATQRNNYYGFRVARDLP